MAHWSVRFARSLAASVLAVAVANDVAAQVPEAANPWETGRAHYGAEEYEEAARYIIEAIQREPTNAQYTLGLARTYFWRGDYERAVYYYDLYIGPLAHEIAPNVRSDDRIDRVRRERDAANAQRSEPSTRAQLPPALLEAREAIDRRVAEGPIVTATGGGALAMYRSLLRAGYAAPDLVELRQRLLGALLSEALAAVPEREASLPMLTLAQWETQRQRLLAWQEVRALSQPTSTSDIPGGALDPSVAATLDPDVRVRGHLALAEAQIQYLNQSYDAAARSFAAAAESQPALIPARIGLLNAMHRGSGTRAQATPVIDQLEATLRRASSPAVGIADVYRAAFAAKSGDIPTATITLGAALGIPIR